MSDTSQGPGWWLASDGKWYPPESQPGAALPPPPIVGSGGEPSPTASQEPRKSSRALVYILIGVLVVGGLAAAGGSRSGSSGSGFDEGQWEAHAVCANFTRDRLKSPGSADFPEYDDPGVRIVGGPTRWTVISFVDSQNGFGALIRTHFRCTITPVGDKWQLEQWAEDD